jgi:putative phosphoesterase
MRIGIIADTHGWLDPRVLATFAGVDAILHAGDIGALAIVEALGAVASVHAVRGNNDKMPDLLTLPAHLDLELAGFRIHLVHRPQDARPGAAAIVVYGHTHQVTVEQRRGVWWVNPGAAGRRGFHRERTLALLDLDAAAPRVTTVFLGPRSTRIAETF